MKSKILSFVLLWCVGFLSAQTILQYPLSNNFTPNVGPPAGMNPTTSYYQNPNWLLGYLTYSNNDYLDLNFDATNLEDMSVEFTANLLALGKSWANYKVYLTVGSNAPEPIGNIDLNTNWLGPWEVSIPVSISLSPEGYPSADHQSDVNIRIVGTHSGGFLGIHGSGIQNLAIVTNTTKLTVNSIENGGYPNIDYNESASAAKDTDFGSLLTMEETTDKTFKITNTGDKKLKIQSIVINQNDQDFEIISYPAPTINKNQSSNFEIRFAPQSQGLIVAEVEIYANIQPHNPFKFQILGRGKSCNLSSVPIAQQNFEGVNENLNATDIQGSPKIIGGTAQVINPNPHGFSRLWPNGNLYDSESPTKSMIIYDQNATVEFGPVDISNEQDVSIEFSVAIVRTGSNNNDYGLNSNHSLYLQVYDGSTFVNQIRLGASNNGTRRSYLFGASGLLETTYGTLIDRSNNGSPNYGTFKLNIPPSYSQSQLRFRIVANANTRGAWLVDKVRVYSGNAKYKTWTGTGWIGEDNNDRPGPREKALFDGNYNFTGGESSDLTICECEVNNGKNLTIPNGRTLTVRNKVINNQSNGENFVVKDGGNLIQIENGAVNTGDITVEKNIIFSALRKQYNFVTAPVVANRNIKETIYTPNPTSVQEYNTATYYFDETLGPYVSGKGYAVKEPASGNEIAKFKGVPFNGYLEYQLSTAGGGFNLIGNPYPSNIDIIKLYQDNISTIGTSFYFWDNRGNQQFTQQGSGYSGDSYAKFNAASPPNSGTGVPAPSAVGLTPVKIPTRYTQVGTGFMIEAISTNKLRFKNENRVKDAGPGFFGKPNDTTADVDRYWLSMETPGEMQVVNAVVYFDGGNDAFTLDDTEAFLSSDDLFTFAGDKAVAIQGKASFHNDDIVPLGYKAFKAGTHIISVYKKEGIFAEAQKIYLVDKLLNKTVNLSAKPYKFLTRAGEFNDRFEIIYKNKNIISTVQDVVEPLLITVTRQSDDLLIMSKGDNLSEVTVYNLLGKPVFTYKDLNTEELRIPAAEYLKQILIVNIVTQSGRTASQKVIPK